MNLQSNFSQHLEDGLKNLLLEIKSKLSDDKELYKRNEGALDFLTKFIINFLQPLKVTVYSTNWKSLFFYIELTKTHNLHLEFFLDTTVENLFFNYFIEDKVVKNGLGFHADIVHYLKCYMEDA